MLICSHAALCSSVDALTCIAAVAWLSAVRATNPRFAAAESTACAFSVAAVVTAPAAARVFSAAARIVESALSSSRLTRSISPTCITPCSIAFEVASTRLVTLSVIFTTSSAAACV